MSYTKLFSEIVMSTVWREKDTTRLVWITMLALRNMHHVVEASVPGLADCARVSIKACRLALKVLSDPDPDSRSQELEGRRIQEVDGGWFIINGEKYRRKMSADERREKNAIYQKNHRERKKSVSTQSDISAKSAQKEEETDTEKRKRKPLSLAECVTYAKTRGISASDAEAFFDSQESGGWTRGGKALRDWQASLRTWKANGWLPSQKQRKNGARADTPGPIDKSKIEVPERFKAWVAERYPAKREEAMNWRTWADVPSNGLRDQWWREEKNKLPIGDLI